MLNSLAAILVIILAITALIKFFPILALVLGIIFAFIILVIIFIAVWMR